MQKVSGWCSFLHHLNGNLEPTWNSKWGKAALSWAALLRLEVPTWFYNFRWLLHVSYKGNFLHVFLTTAPLWRLLRQSAVLPFFRTTASRGSLGEQATWTQVLSLKCFVFFSVLPFHFLLPTLLQTHRCIPELGSSKKSSHLPLKHSTNDHPWWQRRGQIFHAVHHKVHLSSRLSNVLILLNGVTTRLFNSDQNSFERSDHQTF